MIFIAYILIGLPAGLNIAIHLVICAGIIAAAVKERRRKGKGFPQSCTVSLIIPAKNEETNLPRLFSSIINQTRRIDEIILINDRSSDKTPRLFQEFRDHYSGSVKIIDIEQDTHPVNPKQYALTKGIEAAGGSILLFTDADCAPPETWAEEMVKQFSDPGIGVCFAPIHTREKGGFLYKYQVFDHVFRYSYTAGSAGTGLATGGFGNNIAVRKSALDEIGGYRSIEYSVTEDAALISAIRTKSSYAIGACMSPLLKVRAEPQHSWADLSRQERRWSAGAFFSKDRETAAGYGALMFFLFCGCLSIPFGLFFRPFFFLTGSVFLGMTLVAVSGGILMRMKIRHYWLYFIGGILWSALFYTVNNVLSLLKTPLTWKGVNLRKT